jgi:hypothetical protein
MSAPALTPDGIGLLLPPCRICVSACADCTTMPLPLAAAWRVTCQARTRNRSSLKLAALPFTAHKDVYDTERWVGRDWQHPSDPSDPAHHASWATPAYTSTPTGQHPGNPLWKSIASSLSDWRGAGGRPQPLSPPMEAVSPPFKAGVTRKGGSLGIGHGQGSFFHHGGTHQRRRRRSPSRQQHQQQQQRSRTPLGSGYSAEFSGRSSAPPSLAGSAGTPAAAATTTLLRREVARPGLRLSY